MSVTNRLPFTRRTFLKGILAAGAGVSTGEPSDRQAAQLSDDVQWDESFDVIVVGSGSAGLTAAIAAAENDGGQVLLLEKGVAIGGSTAISGGVIQAAGTRFQKQFAHVADDAPEKHTEFWLQEGEGLVDPELVSLLTTQAPDALEWLTAHGLDYVDVYGEARVPNTPSTLDAPRVHVPAGRGTKAQPGTGSIHVAVLRNFAVNRGVEIRTQAQVTTLVIESDKTVVGVCALIDGAERYLQARRGVVLATGGIDHNKDLARGVCAQQFWELETGVCLSVPTNTGDGFRLGIALGAGIAGLGGTIGVPSVTMGAAPLNQEIQAIPGIWVNRYGCRFVDESSLYSYAMRAVYHQEGHLAWAIFDEKVKSLGGAALGGVWWPWSEDLSEEIANGKVVRGETLEELAAKIGVNPTQLLFTVNSWNEDMSDGGVDSLYGKTYGLEELDQPPYYATRVTSINLGSIGGLRINTAAQVVDIAGQPIPRLYAAGMVCGGFFGPYYPGSGAAITATVVLGRIAGRNAAQQP
jgi:fumarate reductase flavoprotein subunit